MAGISYNSILEGITDSCALTEPLSSLIVPPKQPKRRGGSGTVAGATGSAITGSNNQDVDVAFTGSGFTTNITIDLKPYQDAVAALKFDGYKDSVYSTTLSSLKATPSVEYKLGITNDGVNIASVGLLGAITTNSNRVVINASKHMAMMFGQEGVAIASPSRVNIDAGETITLAAQESLFIGLPNKGLQYTTETQKQISLKSAKEGSQKGDPTVDRPYEPLVLGIKLANLLEDILFVLKNAQGVDAWSPVRFNATAQAELSLLANRIPEILSTYAYVDGISHAVVNQTVLNTIKQAQASTPNLASPTKLTGSFAGTGTYPNGSNGNAVGGTGDASTGTLGTNPSSTNPARLAPAVIESIVQSSGAPTELRKRILRVALSYVGQEELPNEGPGDDEGNVGWYDARFENKMTSLRTMYGIDRWYKYQMWCNYFTNLCWAEAYNGGNAYVPAGSSQSIWNSKIKNAKPQVLFAGTSNTLAGLTRIGHGFTLAQAKAGTHKPLPGDMVIYSKGHIEIVCAVKYDATGKLAGVSTIGGNTSATDPRDGGGTKYKKSFSLGGIAGFGQVVES